MIPGSCQTPGSEGAPSRAEPINTYQYYQLGNLPMRIANGQTPLIPSDPRPHQELQLSEHRKVSTFKLWEAEDKVKLDALFDEVNKTVYIIEQKTQFIAEERNWIVLLVWAEPDWEMPANPANITTDETTDSSVGFNDGAVVYK